jgi:hypothetical protein
MRSGDPNGIRPLLRPFSPLPSGDRTERIPAVGVGPGPGIVLRSEFPQETEVFPVETEGVPVETEVFPVEMEISTGNRGISCGNVGFSTFSIDFDVIFCVVIVICCNFYNR